MHKTQKWLLLFIGTFVSLFILNFIAHGLILSGLNADELEGIRRPTNQLNMMVMVVNYVFQTAAVLYFFPKLMKGQSATQSAVTGFIYGGIMFIVTGLNNLFLLPEWPLFVLVSDAIANATVYALLALIVRGLRARGESQ